MDSYRKTLEVCSERLDLIHGRLANLHGAPDGDATDLSYRNVTWLVETLDDALGYVTDADNARRSKT